jgi:hypothetical protein
MLIKVSFKIFKNQDSFEVLLNQQIYFYQKSILIGNQTIKIEASWGSTEVEHLLVYPKVQGSNPAPGI